MRAKSDVVAGWSETKEMFSDRYMSRMRNILDVYCPACRVLPLGRLRPLRTGAASGRCKGVHISD